MVFSSYLSKLALVAIILTVIAVNIFRFHKLDSIPYGAQVDEISCMATVRCLATEGVDAQLRKMPLFGTENAGPKPPTYMYPAVLWTKVFGFSHASFRGFMAFTFVIFLLGLYCLGRNLYGPTYGLICLFAGSISPWAWNFSRIIYESPMLVAYLTWALVFLYRKGRGGLILSGILFSCAMYAYPPARLHVPLILVPLLVFRKFKLGLGWKDFAAFLIPFILVTVPLAVKTINGDLMSRFKGVSITSADYLQTTGKTSSLIDLAGIFLSNFFSHFGFEYLFLRGDANLVHSTGQLGLLSWFDAFGLACLLVLAFWSFKRQGIRVLKNEHVMFAICVFACVVFAIVPAALTNEGLPHSLRSLGGLPFLILLTSLGVWKASQKISGALPAGAVIGVIFAVVLLRTYFIDFPQRSRGMFGFWIMEEAQRAQTEYQWLDFLYRYKQMDLTTEHYLMTYRNYSCTKARETWINFNKFVERNGLQ